MVGAIEYRDKSDWINAILDGGYWLSCHRRWKSWQGQMDSLLRIAVVRRWCGPHVNQRKKKKDDKIRSDPVR